MSEVFKSEESEDYVMQIVTPTTSLQISVLKNGLIIYATDIMGYSDPITMQCKPGYSGQDVIDEFDIDDWEDWVRAWYDMDEEDEE